MSLRRTVAAMIDEMGAGTVDDLLPELEGYTRGQVIQALQNAKLLKLIDCDGQGRRTSGRGGSLPAIYRRKAFQRPAVASVWDLARLAA